MKSRTYLDTYTDKKVNLLINKEKFSIPYPHFTSKFGIDFRFGSYWSLSQINNASFINFGTGHFYERLLIFDCSDLFLIIVILNAFVELANLEGVEKQIQTIER